MGAGCPSSPLPSPCPSASNTTTPPWMPFCPAPPQPVVLSLHNTAVRGRTKGSKGSRAEGCPQRGSIHRFFFFLSRPDLVVTSQIQARQAKPSHPPTRSSLSCPDSTSDGQILPQQKKKTASWSCGPIRPCLATPQPDLAGGGQTRPPAIGTSSCGDFFLKK